MRKSTFEIQITICLARNYSTYVVKRYRNSEHWNHLRKKRIKISLFNKHQFLQKEVKISFKFDINFRQWKSNIHYFYDTTSFLYHRNIRSNQTIIIGCSVQLNHGNRRYFSITKFIPQALRNFWKFLSLHWNHPLSSYVKLSWYELRRRFGQQFPSWTFL